MTNTALAVAIVIELATIGGFIVWQYNEPQERAFSIIARELSFEPTSKDTRTITVPAIAEPTAAESVELTGVTQLASKAFDAGAVDCQLSRDGKSRLDPDMFDAGASSKGTTVVLPANSSQGGTTLMNFVLLKPIEQSQPNCTITVRYRELNPVRLIGFRVAGSECSLTSELDVDSSGNNERQGSTGERVVPELPKLTCHDAERERDSSTKEPLSILTKSHGWFRVLTGSQDLDIWDTEVPVNTSARPFEVVLNRPTTVTLSEASCSGLAGDVLTARAETTKIKSLAMRSEGLAVRFSVSSDWRIDLGGCELSAQRVRWKDTLAACFRGFVALGGAALFAGIMKYLFSRTANATVPKSQSGGGNESV